MLNERLKKQIEFIKEIDKLKAIKRQTLLINEAVSYTHLTLPTIA